MLVNRNFALLWIGQTISLLGDTIFNTTLVVWIALVLAPGQAWAPLAVSGVFIAAAAPALVGPLAGVLVDRWNRRLTMLWMDAIRALLLALLVLATTPLVPLPGVPDGRLPLPAQLGAVYAVVFLASLCARFFDPARFALLGDVVPAALQPRAVGLSQSANYLTFIVGPAIAPPLLLGAGLHWALAIDAVSFAVSFLAILAVRAPAASTATRPPRARFWREFAAGLRIVAANRIMNAVLVALTVGTLGGSVVITLNIFFVTHNLGASAQSYGLFSAAIGAGAVVGAIIASTIVPRVGLVRSLEWAMLFASVSVFVYSRLSAFAPALAVGMFYGLCEATVNVAFGPLLLRVIPETARGRVVALLDATTSTAALVGTAFAGYLASDLLAGVHFTLAGMDFGPIDTIFAAASLLLFAAVLLMMVRLGFKDPTPSESTIRAKESTLVE